MTAGSSGLAVETPGQRPAVVDLEERTWLPRHCRGDQGAFPALLEAYRRPVYSYLVHAGVTDADRDDVFQSIFLKIHVAAGTYQPARPLAPWLFTIVANSARNHLRGRRIDRLSSPADDAQALADPNPDPERVTEARQTIAWLAGALAALPLAQREVLLLITVVGLRQREVYESLKLPLNTVKTHLRRARLALVEALARLDAPADRAGDDDDDL